MLTGEPKSVTDRLQSALNAAARPVSCTRIFDGVLSRLMDADLHFTDVSERVQFKLGVTVASTQTLVCCTLVSDVTCSRYDHLHALPAYPEGQE